MALVGCYVALSKPLANALPVFLLGWMRFGIAAVAMAGWARKPVEESPMPRRIRWLLFVESLFGNFLFSICMLYGVKLAGAVAAGVVMSAIPAAVALLSWAMLRERVTLRTWLSAGCAVTGIGLLSVVQQPASAEAAAASGQFHAWLGNLLIVAAVLCEAAYAVIGKQLAGALAPRRISALINLWGFVLMTPLGLYTAIGFDFSAVPPSIWPLLLFYALAASIWTVWLWMTGLRSVPASQSGIFTVLLPISATLVGVLVLGESLSRLQLLAFAIALASIPLATVPMRRRAP
ncbi:DMT family transporter [Xylophilus sp.]|uniref:DMT family transporter n=1 Tax=Xylophilus sp. TaxID=2653893 RepID=UPI0013B8C564|nr:DMT family transporter [Xylophilus sp.]KAF1049607.1 MAG: hypothetical protein GAK38_00706 [Xylophilus sp.]